MDSDRSDYNDAIKGMDEFGALLCGLIKELLADAGIQVHSISSRVKDFESSSRKLDIKGDRYDGVADLMDLLGVRVVTYFPRDVDKVAEVIEREFTIDKVNSEDKRKMLDTDRFGYNSLHHVAEMLPKRARLTEYKRYAGKRFELQTRSILQHAWSEIEHDLGYKAKSGLPDPLRRRFSMLAGSLELVDEEFERLRKEIADYEDEVDAVIKRAPQTLPINQSTLVASFENESPLNELDEVVAGARKSVMKRDIDTSYIVKEIENLKVLGIENVEQLHDYAKNYKDHVRRFAEIWLGGPTSAGLNAPSTRGIGLFYLNYALAAQREDVELERWGLNITTRSKGLLDRVRGTWKQVVKELGQPQP